MYATVKRSSAVRNELDWIWGTNLIYRNLRVILLCLGDSAMEILSDDAHNSVEPNIM